MSKRKKKNSRSPQKKTFAPIRLKKIDVNSLNIDFKPDLGNRLKFDRFFDIHTSGIYLYWIGGSFNKDSACHVTNWRNGAIEISLTIAYMNGKLFAATLRIPKLSVIEIEEKLKDENLGLRLKSIHKTHTVQTETYTVINAEFTPETGGCFLITSGQFPESENREINGQHFVTIGGGNLIPSIDYESKAA